MLSRSYDITYRHTYIDILRGIGIILVVIGHVSLNTIVYKWIYSFHMPLFFFASGWCYKNKNILSDLKRRVQTVIIPYFSFGFIELLYWQLIERKSRNSEMSFTQAIIGLFLGEQHKLPFNEHLWFLPCFFITVIIFNILVCIGYMKCKNVKMIAYIVTFLMSFVYIIIELPESFFGIDRVFKYIGFYALGNFLAEKKFDNYIKMQKKWINIIIMFLCFSLNFIFAYYSLTTSVMWFLTAIIGIIGVFILSILINENKSLQYLSKISLLILCVHGPIYRIIVKIFSILAHISMELIRTNLLLTTFVSIITILICIVIYKIIIRIAPWMLGNKKSYL